MFHVFPTTQQRAVCSVVYQEKRSTSPAFEAVENARKAFGAVKGEVRSTTVNILRPSTTGPSSTT